MIKDGSFVLIDYVATVKETNEVFATTVEEEARKAGLFRAGEEYEPRLLVVGSAWFPRGLEESLVGHEKGEKLTVEVPPEKAYGARDASKIRSYPIRKFRNADSRLQPGAGVEVDNKLGVVRSVGAGRVQVDFNPPLAGKTLVYSLEIKDVIEEPVRKLAALLHRRVPSVPVERFKVGIEGSSASIEVPSEAFLIEGLQVIKRALFNDATRFVPELKEVVFVERYAKEEQRPAEKPAEAAPAPQAQGKEIEAAPAGEGSRS
ncbi:MAG: peptidylprolyl isomerase [Candidatus Brockarchaeota archaeon]|nr:peptidylprolyl isomerase [Candidatus Brockarchaeota archaeon]